MLVVAEWAARLSHPVSLIPFAVMRHSPAHRASFGPRQRGASVIAIIAVVALVVVGLAVYRERGRAAAKAEQQRIALAQRQEAERVEREREAAAQREREALQEQERRVQQEQRDLLAQTLKRYDDVLARFYDANRVAGGTSRIALAQPVAAMQALHREATQLAIPPCLATGRDDFVDSMRESIEAYLAFMENRDKAGELRASVHFEKAGKSMDRYRAARSTCPTL